MREVIPEGAKVVFLGDGAFDGTALQATLYEAGWSYACRTAMSTVATCTRSQGVEGDRLS